MYLFEETQEERELSGHLRAHLHVYILLKAAPLLAEAQAQHSLVVITALLKQHLNPAIACAHMKESKRVHRTGRSIRKCMCRRSLPAKKKGYPLRPRANQVSLRIYQGLVG